jgi:hypothetical protein
MAVASKIDKTQALQVIYEFFTYFQKCITQSKAPNASEIEQHLSKNFEISSNGQIVGKTAAEYLTRMQKFQKKYSRFEISKPLSEPVLQDNRLAIFYKVNLTAQTGQNKEVFIMALANIEDNKIRSWTQVANEKGTGDWDK